MPKTVLIILAAVVALIVIVVLTGMRYLRADDDDFDDDAPAEHGRGRSRGSHPTREQQARPRARHDDDISDERRTERVGAARAARSGAGDGGQQGPDRRGGAPAARGAGGGQDRDWRDDSLEMPRSGRERPPEREQRPVRAGRGSHADISEPIAASARSGRSQPGRERRDDRDRLAGHEEADVVGRRESRDHRDGRDSRDSSNRIQARPDAIVPEIGDHDERDPRGATRPNARPDARNNGAWSERSEPLPAVKPRQGKSKRDSDGDWPTNQWDELSDVDYWAELASDKPITTTGPSGQGSRAPSRESRQDPRPSPVHEREDASAGSELAVRQPSRRRRQPDHALLPPVGRKPDLAASDRPAAPDRLRAADRHAAAGMPAAGRPAAGRPAAARPAPADDDPLTSPSFPRIAADDSRSYRRTREAASDARQPASREPDALLPARNGRYAPAAQAERPMAYPAVPRVESVRGLEGTSQTRSYPRPDVGGSDFEAMTAGYASTAADRPAPGYPVPASYQVPAVSVAGYPPATGGYPVPAQPPHNSAGSSLEAPGSYRPAPGAGLDGYSAPGSYPSSDLPGYRTETGSGGYLGALPGGYPPASSSASYEGAGGYSLPAQSSGYDNGYPGQATGYQAYAGSGSSSGEHQRPAPGYQATGGGGYPGSAEPGFGGSLPGGHGDLSYPAYPAPVPGEHDALYQAPAPQLSGYQDAPHQAGPYDPAEYPAPVHETGGYAGADPYAVDPYGHTGYGGSGY